MCIFLAICLLKAILLLILYFFMHKDSEKKRFPFFVSPKSKMAFYGILKTVPLKPGFHIVVECR